MTRYVRNTVVQVQIESTYGTDPGSWANTHNVPVMNPRFDEERTRVPRALMRGHMGAFEELHAVSTGRISFEVELAPSGTAGTAPAWGPLMRACGMAQTVTAGNRVEYLPVSSGFESIAIRYFRDGVLHTALGALGTATLRLNAFGLPVMAFDFTTLPPTPSAASAVAGNFAAWQRPMVINEANASAWRVGATYSAGVLSGGTLAQTGNFEVNFGGRVQHTTLLNGRRIDITDRQMTARGTISFAAADEVAWLTAATADATTALSFAQGSAAGSRIALFMAGAQRLQARPGDYQGREVIDTDFGILPVAGNDELRVIVS